MTVSIGGRAVLGVRERLAHALRQHRGRDATRVFVVSLPAVDPRQLLGFLPGEDAYAWQSPDGEHEVGLGIARRLEERGRSRFEKLRESAAALFASTDVVHLDGGAERPLRLFGGAAFDTDSAKDPDWEPFGDCAFVLPRLALVESGDITELRVAIRGDADAAELESVLDQVERLSSFLAASERQQPMAPPAFRARPRAPEPVPASWMRQVEEVRAAIRRGDVGKVVAARRTVVEIGVAADPVEILDRLEGRASGCTRFCFRRQGKLFVGATPERLIRRSGAWVVTHALAGSIARDGDLGGAAARLLASVKDSAEHCFVVDHLRGHLGALCASLEVGDRPRIRELRSLLHLETPVSGRLREDVHILDLVSALHPTPAVGGVPTAAAVRWVRDHEEHPRGWYSGPVGWFDQRGDGDFAVALRALLLTGGRALMFAGAGIVADSDPVAEYQETEVKLGGLRAVIEPIEAARGERELAVL